MLTQPYKGARDFYPLDQKLQNFIFDTWRKICLQFGFEEYNGPLLEPFELYAAKSGQELVNEQLYHFTDRGGRKVAIRPEMTPTVARMVAGRSKSLPKPLKWFSIAQFWRYENPQRGRLREFFQLNADIFGIEGVQADFEVFSIGAAIMKELGAAPSMYEIRVNSRIFTDYLLDNVVGVKTHLKKNMMALVDRKEKMGVEEFERDLKEKINLTEKQIKALLEILHFTLKEVKKYASENAAASDLVNFFEIASESQFSEVFVYSPEIVRGLDYYTGIVIEQWDKNPKNKRSMYGGGRYDNLTDIFAGAETIPATGFAMGDVPLANFLESWNLKPAFATSTLVLVTALQGFFGQSLKVCEYLRSKDICTELYLRRDDSLERQIKYADKKGIPFVAIRGESEVRQDAISIKNLRTGEQKTLKKEEILKELTTNENNHRL